MTTAVLVTGAAALVLLAWWMLRPAWQPLPVAAGTDAAAAHLRVLREQAASLQQALAAGDIGAQQHAQEQAELHRRVLQETPAAAQPTQRAQGSSTQWLVTAGLPLFAAAVYLAIGNPAAIPAVSTAPDAAQQASTSPDADADASPEALLTMLNGMEQRLQQSPADTSPNALQGWTLLARSYASLRRFADAERAYARATALSPDDAQLLADRADVLTVLDGPPALRDQLVQRALQRDPRNLKALTLAGNAAFARQDFAAAGTHWQQARTLVPAGSALAAALDNNLQELRVAAGGAQDKAPDSVAGRVIGVVPGVVTDRVTGRVTGRVTLAPALAARVAPNDTVFVFARAADGPRMPLAILQRRVADLPFDFVLDDSMAMSPQHKLSGAARVVVGVRVSRSGQAAPQSGDLRGSSAATALPAAPLQLVIDSVEP